MDRERQDTKGAAVLQTIVTDLLDKRVKTACQVMTMTGHELGLDIWFWSFRKGNKLLVQVGHIVSLDARVNNVLLMGKLLTFMT